MCVCVCVRARTGAVAFGYMLGLAQAEGHYCRLAVVEIDYQARIRASTECARRALLVVG